FTSSHYPPPPPSFFTHPPPPAISPLSLHDALPIAIRASLAFGSVQNSSGNFVKADPASMTAACVATEGSVRQDVRISLVDARGRSEEHTSELQSPYDLVCRLLLEKKKK